MNLKDLIKEVERRIEILEITKERKEERDLANIPIFWIKLTVEAVEKIKHWNGSTICRLMDSESIEDWQKLKKLLSLSKTDVKEEKK